MPLCNKQSDQNLDFNIFNRMLLFFSYPMVVMVVAVACCPSEHTARALLIFHGAGEVTHPGTREPGIHRVGHDVYLARDPRA